jgi:hypothetical protein
MKSYTLGLVAIVLAIGFSSFGTSNTNKLAKTKTYYAVKNGVSFNWEPTQPDLDYYECISDDNGPYCSIIVADNFLPTNGLVPAPQDLISVAPLYHSQYRVIP